MASLRELIEKQKLEKEKANGHAAPLQTSMAPTQAIPQTQGIPAQAPPVKSGFASRFQKVETELVQAAPAPKPTGDPTPIPVVQKSLDNAQPINKAEITIPTPAPAPPDLTDAALAELRRNLDFLANNIEQKELVGQVVRTIAVQLAENPQFGSAPYMQKADFNLIVRGLRKSFHVQARKKAEGTEKRAKNAEISSEYASLMKDMGISM